MSDQQRNPPMMIKFIVPPDTKEISISVPLYATIEDLASLLGLPDANFFFCEISSKPSPQTAVYRNHTTLYVLPEISVEIAFKFLWRPITYITMRIGLDFRRKFGDIFEHGFEEYDAEVVVHNRTEGTESKPFDSIWDFDVWFGNPGLITADGKYTGNTISMDLTFKPYEQPYNRFDIKFNDRLNVLGRLVSELKDQAAKFYVKDEKDREIDSPILPVLNSSGHGKTRTVLELKHHVPGIFFTLAKQMASTAPPAIPEVVRWIDTFMKPIDKNSSRDEEHRVLVETEHVEMFEKFFLGLEAKVDEIYSEIEQEFADEVDSESKRSKVYEKFREEWNKVGFSYHSGGAFEPIVESASKIVVNNENIEKARQRWNNKFQDRGHIFVVCIDEAAELTRRFAICSREWRSDYSDPGRSYVADCDKVYLFHSLKRAVVNLRLNNLMIVMATLHMQLARFIYDADLDPSTRRSFKEAAILPKIPAFTHTVYLDVSNIEDNRPLKAQLAEPNFSYLFSLGRALWYSRFGGVKWAYDYSDSDYASAYNLASSKLYIRIDNIWEPSKIPKLTWDACSAVLFGKQVSCIMKYSGDMMPSCLGTCTAISQCGKYAHIIYPSEPVLAEAASQLIWRKEGEYKTFATRASECVSETKGKKKQLDVWYFEHLVLDWLHDRGANFDRNEAMQIVARFILLISLQYGSNGINMRYRFCYSMKVSEFITYLIGKKKSNLIKNWSSNIKNGLIAFNHFMALSELSVDILEACLKRRAAVIYPEVGRERTLILPFLMKNEKISVILVRVLNVSDDVHFEENSSLKLTPSHIFGDSSLANLSEYVSLYINLGSTEAKVCRTPDNRRHHLALLGLDKATFPTIPETVIKNLYKYLNFRNESSDSLPTELDDKDYDSWEKCLRPAAFKRPNLGK